MNMTAKIYASSQISLTVVPSEIYDDVIDEDSSDENNIDLGNLLGSQLRTEKDVELDIENELTEGREQARKSRVREDRQDENGDTKREKTYCCEQCDVTVHNKGWFQQHNVPNK